MNQIPRWSFCLYLVLEAERGWISISARAPSEESLAVYILKDVRRLPNLLGELAIDRRVKRTGEPCEAECAFTAYKIDLERLFRQLQSWIQEQRQIPFRILEGTTPTASDNKTSFVSLLLCSTSMTVREGHKHLQLWFGENRTFPRGIPNHQ